MSELLFPQALSRGASQEEISVHARLADWTYAAYEAELAHTTSREQESHLKNEQNAVNGTMRVLAERAIEASEWA